MLTKDELAEVFKHSQPRQYLEEIWWLLEKARETGLEIRVIIEIGISIGSAAMWTSILPAGGLYIGVDVINFGQILIQERFVEIITGNSREERTINLVKETLKRYGHSHADLLYIDGTHEYSGVSSDFKNYSPFVRRGGLIGFHDLNYGGPDRLLNELFGKKEKFNAGAGIGLYYKEE